MIQFFKKHRPVKKTTLSIPKQNDYFSHSAEILAPSLKKGRYVLLFSNQKIPDFKKELFGYQEIQATSIAFLRYDFNSKQRLFVSNSITGKPLKNAQIISEGKTKHTDNDGWVSLNGRNAYYRKKTQIIYHGDSIQTSIQFSKKYHGHQKNAKQINSFLLTDRSIYRPGQPLYFKGIVTYQTDKKRKVLSGARLKVSLYDTNDNLVSEKIVNTNEFGSVNGKFRLPKNRNTGRYRLKIGKDFKTSAPWNKTNFNEGEKTIRVEEYKRPAFAVDFKKVDTSYVLNDRVNLKGNATAFFGGKIANRKVSYTVDRKLQFDWRMRSRLPYFPLPEKRIKTGSIKTDKNGNFEINFQAVPDSTVKKKLKPKFNFIIQATVTDINGETHTASKTLKIAHYTTEVSLRHPKVIEYGKKDSLTLIAHTLNFKKSRAKGTLKIYRYQPLSRILQKRPWPVPEIQTISKNEFLKWFPHQAYDSTELQQNRQKTLVKTFPLNTGKNRSVYFDDFPELIPGHYQAVFIGNGPRGLSVETKSNFQLINKNRPQKLPQEFLTVTGEVGGSKKEVRLNFSSALDKLTIVLELAYQGKLQKQEVIHLAKGKTIKALPISEKAEKISFQYSYNIAGEFKTGRKQIIVPQKEKEKRQLAFQVKTFRNKIEPGRKETWDLRVVDEHQKPVRAEVLASMYDASLDQFSANPWMIKLYQKKHRRSSGLIHPYVHDFSSTRNLRTKNQIYFYPPIRFTSKYTQLKTFGYHFTNSIAANKAYLKLLAYKKSAKKNAWASGIVIDTNGNPLPGGQRDDKRNQYGYPYRF